MNARGLTRLLLGVLFATGLRAADLAPAVLRTEYLADPLGLDVAQPRLSWQLQPAGPDLRALSQSAYHVRVATSAAALRTGPADLWDSGEITSATTTHVVYAGRTLASRQRCFWAVRVRDQAGRWSAWSEPARWTMGLLAPSDWTAKWIGTGESFVAARGDQPARMPPDPWLRKDVTLAAAPTQALAFVASVGFHELYVNGRKVGDALFAPHVTDNSKRARYVTYDITALLRAGPNTLALWLGTGWSIFPKFETADKPRAPIVLAQFDVELPGARPKRIVTDESWRTHPSPSTLLGTWNFTNFGGELYDASQELPDWAAPGLDDRSWQAAVAFTPKLALSADLLEPDLPVTALHAVAITEPRPGVYRVDFGRNFAGVLEVDLTGQPGDRIELQWSEREDKELTHQLRSVYLIGTSGRGTFRNRFNYGSGRWLTLTGLRAAPRPADFRAALVRPAFGSAPAFACSNPLLNAIHDTTLWTFENLTLGGFVVDCPQRERMGYGGDAHATTTTALLHYPLGALYTKWAQDWRDVQGRSASWGTGRKPGEPGSGAQLEEGNLPYTAPTYWGGGGPAWSGFCVHLPAELWRHYGDRRVVEESLPTIERWLAFLETKSRDDLLRRWGGQWDFLGDWLWPGAPPNPAPPNANGDRRDTLFLNNCTWIYNLDTAAHLAAVVDRTDLAAGWSKRAEAVRRAVHREFFDAADASYAGGMQSCLAIALLVGVPPAEVRPAVWRRLEREILDVRHGHIHAGITGGAFLFKTLLEANRSDLIFPMVNQTDYPGWGYMLGRGATTIWEIWEDEARHSRLHSSYLYVGAWFIHGVLGIQPDDATPGFQRFAIRPGPLDRPELTWARGHHDTLHGRISVEWRCEGGQFTLDATVPPNTTALAWLPAATPEAIREGGQPLAKARGAKFVRNQNGRAVVQLQSGTYTFTCPSAPSP